MKRFFVILLATTLLLGCLTGCKKEVEKPVEVTPLTLQIVKELIKGYDEVADGLNGTYTIVSNNTQNDKSETKLQFNGENEDYSYTAEYLIKSTFVDGAWKVEGFELLSKTKTEKQKTPAPNPNTNTENNNQNNNTENNQNNNTENNNQNSNTENNNQTVTPEGTSENDITKYLTMIEKHFTDGKYDIATISNVKEDGSKITCDVAAEERWKFISDVDYVKVEATIENGSVKITSEKITKSDTIANFDGTYKQVNYTGRLSDKMTPYIVFTRDWTWKMYVVVQEGILGDNWLIGSGTYSINNATLTMKPKGGWKYDGYSIAGGSEIGIVPNSNFEFANFTITAVTADEVKIGEDIGTSKAGAHFKK